MRIREQLGAHHRVEVVRTESKRDVLCLWLIANTFHILEVLNDRCVSRLTKTVPVLSDDKVTQALFANKQTRDGLLEVAYEPERLALTRQTI